MLPLFSFSPFPQSYTFGAAEVKPVALRLDYVPNLIYDGERLTVCGSVLNRTASTVSVRMTCSLETDEESVGEPAAEDLTVPAGKEARFEAAWIVADLKQPAVLTVALSAGKDDIDAAKMAVYPALISLPELEVSDDFMVDGNGDRVVLVVQRQVRARESRWGVVKLVQDAVSGGKVDTACALFVGDLMADKEENSHVRLIRSNDGFACFSFLPVKHPAKSDSAGPAIFQTLCEFTKSALNRRYDLVVIHVGSEEARFGTDVEEFRRAIDLMCGLLKSRGSNQVLFVAPVAPEKLSARTARYRQAIQSVTYAAGAQLFDPQPAVTRAGWGRGQTPDPETQKALAAEIIRFVESVTAK